MHKIIFDGIFRNSIKIKRAYCNLGLMRLLRRIIYQRDDDLIISEKILDGTNKLNLNRLEIGSIQENDLDLICKFAEPYDLYRRSPEAAFNEYFQNGCKGFIARINGHIAGYIWWGDSKMTFDFHDPDLKYQGNVIKLKKDEVFTFDLFLEAKNRGGGNAIEFMMKAFEAFGRLGYNKAIGCVFSNNTAAKWTYKLIGCKEIKKIAVRRVLLFIVFRGKKLFFDNTGHKCLYKFNEDTNEK